MTRSIPRDQLDLSLAVTQLMKGVLYRDTHDKAWQHMQGLLPQVRDYVATIGMIVLVDDAEGYAFLRSRPETEDEENPVPRLIPRRSLPFQTSLMLALIRKKLAEFDANASETRLMLTRDQITELMRVFLSTSTNEARLLDHVDATIGKVVELGFLRKIPSQPGLYEVRRVLKAFVDGQWLSDFNERLAEYAAQLEGDEE